MAASTPDIFLLTETADSDHAGRWRIMLVSAAGETKLKAGDREPELHGERLELFAVVRGLEALDRPSHVTLLSDSRYVTQGLTYGLAEWRENDWCWERFGRLAPIKHDDLWRRIDRALEFHHVDCRAWRLDGREGVSGPHRRRRMEKILRPLPPNEKTSRRVQRLMRQADARPGALASCLRWAADRIDPARTVSGRVGDTSHAVPA